MPRIGGGLAFQARADMSALQTVPVDQPVPVARRARGAELTCRIRALTRFVISKSAFLQKYICNFAE
jgi:hypothetical protein